jgi:hypothetical protein
MYKLAVIKSPFNQRETESRLYFGMMLSLRMSGYSKIHGIKVVPIDVYDYFSTNILLYEELNGKKTPLASCRIISLDDCKMNNLDFPPLENLYKSKNIDAYNQVMEIIRQNRRNNLDTTYDCSLTISPEIMNTKKSKIVIKYIVGSTLQWHLHKNINIFIVSATLKVKTDKLFKKLGFCEISNNSIYNLESVNNELAVMMKYTGNPTPYGTQWIKDSENIWRRREEFLAKDIEYA